MESSVGSVENLFCADPRDSALCCKDAFGEEIFRSDLGLNITSLKLLLSLLVGEP